MKHITIISLLSLLTFSAQAEMCEGLNACTELYTKLTGEKPREDISITDEMTIAVPNVDLTKENAKKEFQLFLNKNVVHLTAGGQLVAKRHGDFLKSPIYVVSKENMPQMFSKEGLVTLVYHSEKDTKKLISSKVRMMMSKKAPNKKSLNSIVEFNDTKIISVSDTFEHASKVINAIMKADK